MKEPCEGCVKRIAAGHEGNVSMDTARMLQNSCRVCARHAMRRVAKLEEIIANEVWACGAGCCDATRHAEAARIAKRR